MTQLSQHEELVGFEFGTSFTVYDPENSRAWLTISYESKEKLPTRK